MYKNLALLFIFTLIYSCSEPVEEIEPDSFLNIAGARVGLASQQPIDWDSQAIDPYMNMDPKLSSSRVPLFGDCMCIPLIHLMHIFLVPWQRLMMHMSLLRANLSNIQLVLM